MDVNVLAVAGFSFLANQFDVFGDLGPALEIGNGALVGRHNFEHLPRRERTDLFSSIYQRHGTVHPARIQHLVKRRAHQTPPAGALSAGDSAQTFLPNSSVSRSSSGGEMSPAFTRLIWT